MSLTASDIAAIAAMLDSKIDAKLAAILPTPSAPVTPTVSPESVAVVLPEASEVSAIKGWTPEQLAADLLDPLRNAYTPVVRAALFSRKVDSEYYRLYEPLWRAERARLQGLGVANPGKEAQVNFAARLKIERERLAVRDGGQVGRTMAPVIAAETRRSSGTHSDPTANQAIGNVSRAERAAQLRAEADALENDGNEMNAIIQLDLASGNSKSLTRSAAQKRAGTNPFQFSVDKLVRDAKASGQAKEFVLKWAKDSAAKSPKTSQIVRSKAVKALEALGYTVKA